MAIYKWLKRIPLMPIISSIPSLGDRKGKCIRPVKTEHWYIGAVNN